MRLIVSNNHGCTKETWILGFEDGTQFTPMKVAHWAHTPNRLCRLPHGACALESFSSWTDWEDVGSRLPPAEPSDFLLAPCTHKMMMINHAPLLNFQNFIGLNGCITWSCQKLLSVQRQNCLTALHVPGGLDTIALWTSYHVIWQLSCRTISLLSLFKRRPRSINSCLIFVYKLSFFCGTMYSSLEDVK